MITLQEPIQKFQAKIPESIISEQLLRSEKTTVQKPEISEPKTLKEILEKMGMIRK